MYVRFYPDCLPPFSFFSTFLYFFLFSSLRICLVSATLCCLLIGQHVDEKNVLIGSGQVDMKCLSAGSRFSTVLSMQALFAASPVIKACTVCALPSPFATSFEVRLVTPVAAQSSTPHSVDASRSVRRADLLLARCTVCGPARRPARRADRSVVRCAVCVADDVNYVSVCIDYVYCIVACNLPVLHPQKNEYAMTVQLIYSMPI